MDSYGEPVYKNFATLTAHDLIGLAKEVLSEYNLAQFGIEKTQESSNDLQLSFWPHHKKAQDASLMVQALDQKHGGISLSFSYHIPQQCCDNPGILIELSKTIKSAIIAFLERTGCSNTIVDSNETKVNDEDAGQLFESEHPLVP